MNDPVPPPARRLLQPFTLLAGVALGLAAFAWAGHVVARRDWHKDFFRFHPSISLETQYQPTIAEMLAIVRARCRPEQVLVVVGGNSVFQGVGQPVEKLWSRRLQELLGDRYAVVNLAFRGGGLTDGGAIAAEALRREFPRQILLANALPFTGASPAGSRDYRFMMYDAYWKGWLVDFPARDVMLRTHTDAAGYYAPALDESIAACLDARLRFREFWNWWSCTRFFTFPTTLTPEAAVAFRARDRLPDLEPDFETMPVQERFSDRFLAAEMDITRATSGLFYDPGPQQHWVRRDVAFRSARFAMDAFPPALRSRTLIVLCANSPYYVARLTPSEQHRNDLAYADSVALWHELGHPATDYGPGFTADDFGDRTHLTASGGRKLAARLAPQIEELARKLGYLNH